MSNYMKNKIVSIIIPTFNSEKYITKCLTSIKKQSYKDYEIIIVDQKSTDNTVAIAKSFDARVITTSKPKFYSPPSKSRNIGARQAKGEILYHLDSDMQLSKQLLKEAVYLLEKNEEIGALMVPEEDIVRGFFSKCKRLERLCYRGNDSIDSARIVKKKIFREVGGYEEKISSGEDFSIQQKYKDISQVGYCKNVVYHDLTELSFFMSVKKKFSYGKTANQFFKESKQSGTDIIKEEIGMYIKNRELLFSHPILAFGMIFMKASEVFAGMLGLILATKYE